MSTEKHQIRSVILYEFQNGLNSEDTAKKINQRFGEGSINSSTVRRWFKKFKDGDFDLNDRERSGRPEIDGKDQISDLIKEDPTLSLRQIEVLTGLSYGTVQASIHKLGLSKRSGRYVPHELKQNNKDKRRDIAMNNIEKFREANFLKNLITSDESWIYLDNRGAKKQWLAPNQPAQAAVRPSQFAAKVMLCIWWDYSGPIHWELLQPGATVDSFLYCNQLQRVQEKLTVKRPSLVNRRKVIFLHDNARPHISSMTRQKISDLNWELLPHPPYSPDLAPSDYHLFRSLNHFVRDKKFDNRTQVENAIESFLASKSTDFYAKGIFDLPNRWKKTIESDGDYFID